MSTHPFDLARFTDAQAPVIERVLQELAAGDKRTHWMWFVFPQLKALGRSSTALHYGLASKDEAAAYWQHPVLGPRLQRCVETVLGVQGRTAHEIFHTPDDLKFLSCLTLFEAVAPDAPAFAQAIERYYGGRRDQHTLELIR